MANSKSYSKAVVASGGKQHFVTVGSEIKVEKLENAVGEQVKLTPLMAYDDQNTLAKEDLSKLQVSAEVLEQGKGEKIRVFKFKSKKRYRRTQGHRQQFTKLKITAIAAAVPVKAEKTV